MVKTSLIILNWNTLKYLKKCIISIKKYTTDMEIILLDNNSSEKGTKQYISSVADKFIFNDYDTGFARGNNQCAKLSEEEYVCFLNSDTIVGKDWLTDMLELFKNPDCGAVGPLGNPKPNPPIATYNQYVGQYSSDCKVNRLVGFCLLMKRDLFNQIKWDEDFFNGYEDDYLSECIKSKGFNLYISSKSNVRHDRPSRSFEANKVDYWNTLERNRIIFEKKIQFINKDKFI